MSNETAVIALKRKVEVTQIPSGQKAELEAGSEVMITQSLGGTFTVVVQNQPGLYRISGKDADALGKSVESSSTGETDGGPLDEKKIWEQLKTCYDPEIPVNIVDLGLIYSMEIKPQGDGMNAVEVKMTLTAQGCGMGPSIASDAREKILSVPGVGSANVDVVWDPIWSPDRISPEGKAKLGMA
jgi:probable FeS assembly SUF system protein SufT